MIKEIFIFRIEIDSIQEYIIWKFMYNNDQTKKFFLIDG